MARRQRRFEIRVLDRAGGRELAASPAGAAREAARLARRGHHVEVVDLDHAWTAMTCRPERRRWRTIARCEVKEPFKRRIKFTGRARR